MASIRSRELLRRHEGLQPTLWTLQQGGPNAWMDRPRALTLARYEKKIASPTRAPFTENPTQYRNWRDQVATVIARVEDR